MDDDRCKRCGEPYANDLTGLCMDCECGESEKVLCACCGEPFTASSDSTEFVCANHEDSWEDEPDPGRILARHLLCDEVAVANANAGVAMCDREHGHEGPHMPHPSFWDAV